MSLCPHWIRRRRRLAGLTQAQLAERVGVHVNAVGRWERGERQPDARSEALLRMHLDPEWTPPLGLGTPGEVGPARTGDWPAEQQ